MNPHLAVLDTSRLAFCCIPGRRTEWPPTVTRGGSTGEDTHSSPDRANFQLTPKRKKAIEAVRFIAAHLKNEDDYAEVTTTLILNKVKVVHARLPSVWFQSWSRFFAVSLQVTWVINPAVGCHYFSPGLQLPSQPLTRLLPISLLGEQRHDGCEQFA